MLRKRKPNSDSFPFLDTSEGAGLSTACVQREALKVSSLVYLHKKDLNISERLRISKHCVMSCTFFFFFTSAIRSPATTAKHQASPPPQGPQ